jgi:hypothetical protein
MTYIFITLSLINLYNYHVHEDEKERINTCLLRNLRKKLVIADGSVGEGRGLRLCNYSGSGPGGQARAWLVLLHQQVAPNNQN